MTRIDYKRNQVPSWSWMAYDGAIDYIDVPYEHTSRAINLHLDQARFPWFYMSKQHALVVDVGTFVGCTSKPDSVCERIYGIEGDVGCVWYDTDSRHDLAAEKCIILLRQPVTDEALIYRFYILVVKPTLRRKEYVRVGAGWIRSDYVKMESRMCASFDISKFRYHHTSSVHRDR